MKVKINNKIFGKIEVELKEGLNVIFGNDEISYLFAGVLKSYLGKNVILLDEETDIEEIKKLIKKRKNLIIPTDRDEVTNIADTGFGLTQEGKVVSLVPGKGKTYY